MQIPTRIIYIVESPFSVRDQKRFCVDELRHLGFEVAILDLTSLLYPKFEEQYSRHRTSDSGIMICHSLIDVFRKLNEFAPHFIWNFSRPHWRKYLTRVALYAIFKRTAIVIEYASIAGPFITHSAPRSWLIQSFKGYTKRVLFLPFCLLRPDYSFVGGTSGLDISVGTPIFVHSLDYDNFLWESRTLLRSASPKYLLFLDEDYVFHEDYAQIGMEAPVTADKYYREVNSMLQSIGRRFGLEVVIQVHPRADRGVAASHYEHRLSDETTACAVLGADLVVTHDSTAIQIAVLADKPIVLIETTEIERHPLYHPQIHRFAQALNLKVLGSKDFPFEGEFPTIDSNAYRSYVDTYVKTPGSPVAFSYEILAEALTRIVHAKSGSAGFSG
jgi:hypothetical protein